jgi:hypothetical protein
MIFFVFFKDAETMAYNIIIINLEFQNHLTLVDFHSWEKRFEFFWLESFKDFCWPEYLQRTYFQHYRGMGQVLSDTNQPMLIHHKVFSLFSTYQRQVISKTKSRIINALHGRVQPAWQFIPPELCMLTGLKSDVPEVLSSLVFALNFVDWL